MTSKRLVAGLVGGALVGVGVYLMATSKKEWVRDSFCLLCPPCTSEDQPGCSLRHGGKMALGFSSTLVGGFSLALMLFGWPLDCLEIATDLSKPLVAKDTHTLARLAKDYRNFIHPGRAKKEGRNCTAGFAQSVKGALIRVIEDLEKRYPKTP